MLTPGLARTTFTTSRTLEFFTERELAMQLGVSRERWGLAILKELLDNALDACEQTDRPPVITVSEDQDTHTLSVQDNGPGLRVETLEKSLDYTVRVSDKAYYVSPSRGQLGNALKCLWALPYVLSGPRQQGRVDVSTSGMRYEVRVSVDHIAQQPVLTLTPVLEPEVKSGTTVTIHWPQQASYPPWGRDAYFYFSGARDLVTHYALLNPHVTFAYVNGVQIEYPACSPQWVKWMPRAPTSPHWYTATQFRALLSAFLNADRQTEAGARLVSTVLEEFDGFSGSAAQGAVLRPLGLRRATLEALVDEGAITLALADALLTAMQARSRPVAPKRLGVLGVAYLSEALATLYAADLETILYRAQKGTTDGLPYVLEVACGQRTDDDARRQLLCGFNCTPALGVPFRDLPWICGNADVNEDDPVTLAVHVTCPRLDATDRGKTAVTLPGEVTAAMRTLVEKATEPWTKLKAKARREGKRRALAEARERRAHRPMSVKEACYRVMEQAYMHASDHGRFPANARQIMYAARPLVIALTGKDKPWKKSQQFTQGHLIAFLEDHPDLAAQWDVVFDARGHFTEPHASRPEHAFDLGSLQVRRYCQDWQRRLTPTLGFTIDTDLQLLGPRYRYRYALFIEKEGFDEQFAAARLAERYDLAMMSSKGMTVTALRQLVDQLSQTWVTILVLHDLDKAGLEILRTFTTSNHRYQYHAPPTVIDLGLRWDDVEQLQLQQEEVSYPKNTDPRPSLSACGASPEEHTLLASAYDRYDRVWSGHRVELNAMTTPQFLTWLEAKLHHHGVQKFVPDQGALATVWRYYIQLAWMDKAVANARAQMPEDEAMAIPDDLEDQVRAHLHEDEASSLPWEAAIEALVAKIPLVE